MDGPYRGWAVVLANELDSSGMNGERRFRCSAGWGNSRCPATVASHTRTRPRFRMECPVIWSAEHWGSAARLRRWRRPRQLHPLVRRHPAHPNGLRRGWWPSRSDRADCRANVNRRPFLQPGRDAPTPPGTRIVRSVNERSVVQPVSVRGFARLPFSSSESCFVLESVEHCGSAAKLRRLRRLRQLHPLVRPRPPPSGLRSAITSCACAPAS
jgi:hypothetical protein